MIIFAKWVTPEILDQIKVFREQGRGAQYISRELGVSKGKLSGLLWRMGLSPSSSHAIVGISHAIPSITVGVAPVIFKTPGVEEFHIGAAPAWGTATATELYKAMWVGGVKSAVIDGFFDISPDQSRSLRTRECLPRRDPSVTSVRRDDRGAALRAAHKKTTTPPTPKKAHRPLGSANGGRTAHHLGTLLNWRVINETKITHAPGQCRWPLSCSEKTNGNFCQHHAGLLDRRAA